MSPYYVMFFFFPRKWLGINSLQTAAEAADSNMFNPHAKRNEHLSIYLSICLRK
jgi:hypothetical protein